MTIRYRWTRGEPDLEDMLRDDVIQTIMRRDGVSTQDLDALIQRVRRRLLGTVTRLPQPGARSERRPVS